MYRTDHIKVLKALAEALPKRPSFKTSDVVATAFKRAENGDRRVRNAYRKIRKEGHVEIGERGEYRLTQAGAVFCKKAEAEDWKLSAMVPAKKKSPIKKKARVAKKTTKKKTPKKAAKKKVAKKRAAPKKKTAKRAAPKKKAAAKKAKKAPAKSGNNAPSEPKKSSSESATLTF